MEITYLGALFGDFNLYGKYNLDLQFNLTSLPGNFYILNLTTSTGFLKIYYDISVRKFKLEVENNGGGGLETSVYSDEYILDINEWYHFKYTRVNTTGYLFINMGKKYLKVLLL
jgi:hypothetical protein